MAVDALAAVALRNQFYRDNYRRVMMTLLLSMVINIALGGILIYQITNPPEPVYFATSVNGRVTKLSPLDKPNQSDSAVLQWANSAAIAAYSYNFVNYRSELQSASEFFTPAGWDEFVASLRATNNLEAVRQKKLIVSGVATRAPVVLQKGILRGRYSWRVQIPILVTYQSASAFAQERYVITLLISRISTLNSPRGIGISQFIATPGSEETPGREV